MATSIILLHPRQDPVHTGPMPSYWPIVIQVIFACALAITIILVSHLFGQRGRAQRTKDSPYECGILTKAEAIGPFSIKFYRVALLFILVDIALAFLIPWALSFKSANAAGHSILIPGIIFLGLLSIGVAYQIKGGILDWKE